MSLKIQDIIIWILFILSLIIFFWYLFSNSPTFEQTILGIAVTFLFTISFKIGGFGVKLDNIERRFNILEKSFIKLANDFKSHLTKYHG